MYLQNSEIVGMFSEQDLQFLEQLSSSFAKLVLHRSEPLQLNLNFLGVKILVMQGFLQPDSSVTCPSWHC